MGMRQRLWVERQGDDPSRDFRDALGLSSLLAKVIAKRGFCEVAETEAFLHARLNALPDPDLLPDMGLACGRLAEALTKKQRIAVHGDYDVDGISGTALLVEGLRSFGGEVEYHIPLRMVDGYGLSADAIRRAAENNCSLILSVDCGISALGEADLANELGLDLIVTDHHQPPGTLPNCLALVNPHLQNNRFPWPDLAGVGVAFFLLLALRRRLREDGWFHRRQEPDLRNLLDLVALGTIADMVPLGGVNRILVRAGLQLLECGRRPGIDALKQVAEVKRVTCGSVGFRLAPRLNAAGRLEDARLGVQLLLGEGGRSMGALATHLDRCNRERQQIEEETLQQAINLVEGGAGAPHSLVLAARGWHPGVIGIVASRLVERYYLPTVMIALDDQGVGKGSARSIRGFHLFAALQASSATLEGFGGHAAAAGLTLLSTNVERFRADFESAAAAVLTGDTLVPRLEHDGEVKLSDLDLGVVGEIADLAPFGIGNPQPSFVCSNLQVLAPQIVGGKHLRFRADDGSRQFGCIAFGMADRVDELSGGDMDLLFRPEVNSFRGQESVQLQILDLRPSPSGQGID